MTGRSFGAHHDSPAPTDSASELPRLTMAPEGDIKKRVSRKLTKKRKEGHQVTMDIPERFKDGDDAEEDFGAPAGGSNAYMNQSVFGMIAAAGSQVDFNARFDAQSSDEEEDSSEPPSRGPAGPELLVEKTRQEKPVKPQKHRRKFSENKLLRSLPRLGTGSKPKTKASPLQSPQSPALESHSDPVTPSIELSRTPSRDAPVMSRMLSAKAELAMRPSFDMPRSDNEGEDSGGAGSSSLAKRLMEIFDFVEAEDVIEGMSKF